jgi:hypothetical protein
MGQTCLLVNTGKRGIVNLNKCIVSQNVQVDFLGQHIREIICAWNRLFSLDVLIQTLILNDKNDILITDCLLI